MPFDAAAKFDLGAIPERAENDDEFAVLIVFRRPDPAGPDPDPSGALSEFAGVLPAVGAILGADLDRSYLAVSMTDVEGSGGVGTISQMISGAPNPVPPAEPGGYRATVVTPTDIQNGGLFTEPMEFDVSIDGGEPTHVIVQGDFTRSYMALATLISEQVRPGWCERTGNGTPESPWGFSLFSPTVGDGSSVEILNPNAVAEANGFGAAASVQP